MTENEIARGFRAGIVVEENAVVEIRSVEEILARLVFFSQLRDPNTGRFSYPLGSDTEAKGHVHTLLERLHQQTFRAWMRCPPDDQLRQIKSYFASLECHSATVVQTWLNLEPYRCFVPASALPAERERFATGLRAALQRLAERDPSHQESDWLSEELPVDGRLLTTEQVAGWLAVPRRTLRLWAECSLVPATKVGRQWRFAGHDIQQWLAAHQR